MPANSEILARLQQEILHLQGFRPQAAAKTDLGLGPITEAFPGKCFPTAAIHEMISPNPEDISAASGFTAGLLSRLMQSGGACLWVSCTRKIYPPGLKTFGIAPDTIIFVDTANQKEVLWATEEALKCDGLAAVVAEIRDLDMTASRRFQLAVEQSRVTGLILRNQPRNLLPTAAIARWHISQISSEPEPRMPGLGFPRWDVQLSRIRNGQPGRWQVEWQAGRFHFETAPLQMAVELQKRTG